MPTKKAEPKQDLSSGGILCGTDFSENAAAACKVGAAFAARLGAPFTLVHNVTDKKSGFSKKAEWEEFCQSIEQRLRREAETLGQPALTVKTKIIANPEPDEGMLKLIRHDHPALCVVASVSKTTWDLWTIGSISEAIAQSSPSPTLVVRDSTPLLKWAAGKSPLKVFVALDFSPSATAALQWVSVLKAIGPCEVTVGHVYCPPDEAKRLGLPHAATFMQEQPEIQQDLERTAARTVTEVLGKNAATLLVKGSFSRPDFPIINMAREANADLLVVGTRQRKGLSRLWNASISRGILHHAKMSVAIVPASSKRSAK